MIDRVQPSPATMHAHNKAVPKSYFGTIPFSIFHRRPAGIGSEPPCPPVLTKYRYSISSAAGSLSSGGTAMSRTYSVCRIGV